MTIDCHMLILIRFRKQLHLSLQHKTVTIVLKVVLDRHRSQSIAIKILPRLLYNSLVDDEAKDVRMFVLLVIVVRRLRVLYKRQTFNNNNVQGLNFHSLNSLIITGRLCVVLMGCDRRVGNKFSEFLLVFHSSLLFYQA